MIKTESGYFYSVSGVRVIYIKYIFIRETGQFSSKGIIKDFIGNLNTLTVSRDSLNKPYNKLCTGY